MGLMYADESTDGKEKSNFHFSLANVPDISNIYIYIYIYIYTHVHTYIYMCVCVCVCVYTLATEPGISLIILTPMKILQRNLNRSTFSPVWTQMVATSSTCYDVVTSLTQ